VVVGGEIDGRLTPHELGLGRMLNPAGGFIGEAGIQRAAHHGPGRLQLVGLEATSGSIPEGAMLLAGHGKPAQGHVTASAYRVIEGGSIALALLTDGAARHGEELLAHSPTRKAQAWVRVCAPHFYDPQGTRYRD
jgi:sarcosine oxidase subunit alpha